MKELVTRFVTIGDTHGYQTNQGFRYGATPVVGVDDRDGGSPPPKQSKHLRDMFHDRFRRWEAKPGGVDFFIHTGDVINSDDPGDFHEFYDKWFAPLDIEDYFCVGNHDHVTQDEVWSSIFGHGLSHAFERNGYGYILLNSGKRQDCLDQSFLREALSRFGDLHGVFFVSHVPRFAGEFRGDAITSPGGTDSPSCPEIMEMLVQQDNLICCLHGHFHEFNNVMMHNGIPIVFTNHWGGYGVNYYGLRIFEVYDDGSVYTFLDGFAGEIEGDTISYEEHEKRYFNLCTKFDGGANV